MFAFEMLRGTRVTLKSRLMRGAAFQCEHGSPCFASKRYADVTGHALPLNATLTHVKPIVAQTQHRSQRQ
eukprot:657291-Pyramimonas_sp.AAC.1